MKISRAPASPEPFLDSHLPAGGRVRAGLIRFRAGERVPPTGSSLHRELECSYVVAGSLTVTSGGAKKTAGAGDVISIPPGEEHFTEVHGDTSIVYLLIG
jgi:quercetin dioxygenase-like cupin family protein